MKIQPEPGDWLILEPPPPPSTYLVKAHELAPHVSRLMRILPPDDMGPIAVAMQPAINLLSAEIGDLTIDWTNPDDAMAWALRVQQGPYSEAVKDAGKLLYVCMSVVERRFWTENDRANIPVMLSSPSIMQSVKQRFAASKPRPRDLDTLQQDLELEVKIDHERSTKEYIRRLEADAKLTEDENGNITFLDLVSNKEVTITKGSFRNRVTLALKKHKPKGQT